MKVVYISGKYSGDIDTNIQKAREIAIKLWESGYAVICPHLNSSHMELDCKASYEQFLAGDVEILRRCDAIIMLPEWEQSKGAWIEWKDARARKIPIYLYPDLPEII